MENIQMRIEHPRANYIDATVENDRANINNTTNTTNNYELLQTSKDHTPSDDLYEMAFAPSLDRTSSLAQEVASLDAEGVVEHAAAPWRYIKVDLFDNANDIELGKNKRKFKVNLAFILEGETEFQRLTAQLNTEFRFALRGLNESVVEEREHKDTLRNLYQTLNNNSPMQIKASKCYQKNPLGGKGTTIPGLACVLHPLPDLGCYELYVVYYKEIYKISLTAKNLSDKQRRANIVSSGEAGQLIVNKRMSAREFFKR